MSKPDSDVHGATEAMNERGVVLWRNHPRSC